MKYSDMQKDIELIRKHFFFADYEITRLSMIEFKHYHDQATKLEKENKLAKEKENERQLYETISQKETGITIPPETIVETVDEE